MNKRLARPSLQTADFPLLQGGLRMNGIPRPLRAGVGVALVTALVLAAALPLPASADTRYWTDRNANVPPPTTTMPAWPELVKMAKPAVVNVTSKVVPDRSDRTERG